VTYRTVEKTLEAAKKRVKISFKEVQEWFRCFLQTPNPDLSQKELQ
jgi:hypothetical protein